MKGYLRKFFNSKKEEKPTRYFNSFEIQKPEDGKIKVVPIGKFPVHHCGAHEITAENIQQMADNLKNTGTDVLFDYGHDSVWYGGAKAAGWSAKDSVEVRNDGLYIDYPTFTNAAQQTVDNKEYRYFSPVYVLHSLGKDGSEIGAQLKSVALTNTPYMDTEIDHIGNSQTEMPETDKNIINSQTTGSSTMNTQLLAFLGLGEKATDAEIEAKLNSVRTDLGLDEKASIAEIVAKINSANQEVQAAKAASQTVEQRLAALEAGNKENAAEQLINSAIDKGKILPADKSVWLNSAKADFNNTKKDLDARKENSAVPGKIEKPDQKDVKVNSTEAAADYMRNQLKK